MSKSGPIILIEDDADDESIFEEVLQELGITNPLIWLTSSDEAFHYLKSTSDQPFIIFCDVNLPGQNGIEFKRQLDNDEELRKKCIPFIFYSTSVNQATVNEAYTSITVQGFFQKGNSYSEIKTMIKQITDYWQSCRHPNS